MQFPELTQLAKGAMALGRGGKGDDTVRDPFVWAQGGRLRVLANEGQLVEVMVLQTINSQSMQSVRASYV